MNYQNKIQVKKRDDGTIAISIAVTEDMIISQILNSVEAQHLAIELENLLK